MTVIQISSTSRTPQHYTYNTGDTTIQQAAQEFGETDDVVELYDDNGDLVGIAKWPQGSRAYMYCINPAEKPPFRAFRY